MRVTLIRPCADCPARVDIPGYLRPGRAAGIIGGLLEDDWAVFPCHQTTVTREDPETGIQDRVMVETSHMCAGFMIMLLKLGQPPVRVRLALMSGELRYEDIDMAAKVAETPEQLEEHHASSWR